MKFRAASLTIMLLMATPCLTMEHGDSGERLEAAESIFTAAAGEPTEEARGQKRRQDSTSEQLLNYTCPITSQIMRYPVVAEDGHSYEQAAIETWFRTCRRHSRPLTSPKTGAALHTSTLFPNHTLRAVIQESGLMPDLSPEEAPVWSLTSRAAAMVLTIEGAGTAAANGDYHRFPSTGEDVPRWVKTDGHEIVFSTDARPGYGGPDAREGIGAPEVMQWSEWHLNSPAGELLYFILDDKFTPRHTDPDHIQSDGNAAIQLVAPPLTGDAEWWIPKNTDRATSMTVNIMRLGGPPLAIAASPEDTIITFLDRISKASGVPVDQMRIINSGSDLSNNLRTLASYNIGDGSTLHMVLRLGYSRPGITGWSNGADPKYGIRQGTAGLGPSWEGPRHRLA